MPLCGKVLFILIEVLMAKETPQNAARTLMSMLDTCVDKVEAMVIMLDEVAARAEETNKGETGKEIIDVIFIETAKPVGAAAYALERPEDFIKGLYHSHK